jgi:hypothetical protein
MYYPKSQIKPNLYTPGGEYVFLSTGEEYTGYYHELSTGKRYTGKTPNSGKNQELIPPDDSPETVEDYTSEDIIRIALFDSDPDPVIDIDLEKFYSGEMIINYRNLTSNVPTRIIPPYHYPNPTTEEYNIGEYRRYFAKKNTDQYYIETNKDTYEKFLNEDPTVALDCYSVISLSWSLSGNSSSTNKNLVAQVERKYEWYGFSQYFQNNGGY